MMFSKNGERGDEHENSEDADCGTCSAVNDAVPLCKKVQASPVLFCIKEEARGGEPGAADAICAPLSEILPRPM